MFHHIFNNYLCKIYFLHKLKMYLFFYKMRRSRSLSFKKEQEQRLKSIMSPSERKEEKRDEKSDRNERKTNTASVPPPSKSRYEREISYSDDDGEYSPRNISPKPQSKPTPVISSSPPRKQSPPPVNRSRKPQKQEEPSDHEEEIIDSDVYSEQEEEKPSPKRGRPTASPRKQERIERPERTDRDERDYEEDDKRKKLIVPRSVFQKIVQHVNLSASMEIFPQLQHEMIDYVVEVIKIVSNNDTDDEIVVKDSNLRFLGQKEKSIGLIDIKLFEKIYGEAEKILSHNVTFTSESFKSLCKYTEIHIIDFLTKAKAIMNHANRKRLTLADIELLKYILE